MSVFSIDEAAWLLGVSTDTIRHCADAGQLATTMASGRYGVDGAELARFAKSLNSAPSSPEVPSHAPARNQFPGLVTRVVRDHIMAQVEIQAGPHWIVSLVPVKVVDKLKLKPGSHAIASVAPTDVIVRPSPTGANVRRDERY
jgi:excisionase family DNA binding protein